jgi:hypothetical protein
MGILSWLFPTDADRLAKARARMAAGKYEDARSALLHCHAPEAEALYDECSAAIDKADRVTTKKRLASAGFHGWKIEVSLSSARQKAQLEALIAQELARAGVDLEMPDIDEDAVKDAFARAQRRAPRGNVRGTGTVKLVPRTAAPK